jgi:hypothetical protein
MKPETEIFNTIKNYLNKKISPLEFKDLFYKYWRLIRDEGPPLNDEKIKMIDRIFTALDQYCEDVNIRDSTDLNEEQLYIEVKNIVEKCEG